MSKAYHISTKIIKN